MDPLSSWFYIIIDNENFDNFLKWFNQNEDEIHNLSSNFPIMRDDVKNEFYDKYSENLDLPPFPPLFDFSEKGNKVAHKLYTISENTQT